MNWKGEKEREGRIEGRRRKGGWNCIFYNNLKREISPLLYCFGHLVQYKKAGRELHKDVISWSEFNRDQWGWWTQTLISHHKERSTSKSFLHYYVTWCSTHHTHKIHTPHIYNTHNKHTTRSINTQYTHTHTIHIYSYTQYTHTT